MPHGGNAKKDLRLLEQMGQTLLYMINCISIVLNGRNHRGTLRGTLRGGLRGSLRTLPYRRIYINPVVGQKQK